MNVSIIIPNYNHESFLRQRIESVLNQTFRSFEVIILDDSSTDKSREVIEEYRRVPKIAHIVFNEINSGSVFQQWQKGINLATGDLLWIAESDDFADMFFLERMVPLFLGNPDIALAYSDSYIVSSNGSRLTETWSDRRNKRFNTKKWSRDYVNKGWMEIIENLCVTCTINNVSAVLFRKQVFQSQLFDIEFKLVGDWYCYLKICSTSDIAYHNAPLNFYREHASNASNNLYKDSLYILEFLKLHNWMLSNLKFLSKKRIRNLFFSHIRLSGSQLFSLDKIKIYAKASKVNASLLFRLILHNLWLSFKERFYKAIWYERKLGSD